MALDEALLEFSTRIGVPVFRVYSWIEPAATFGYFQRYGEVASWTTLRPLIRRPTGGGLVPHDADWTYSLIFPPNHPWYALKALESYRRVHEWICKAFGAIGIGAELSPGEQKTKLGQCFVGAERFDVLWNGAKVGGAAQRRNRFGLLIQGSVQDCGLPVSRHQWLNGMLETARWPERIQWKGRTVALTLELDEEITRRVEQLTAEKYSQASYNERR
jgi:lipoate-protein ligase A